VTKVSLDAIRAVRARVERSVPESRPRSRRRAYGATATALERERSCARARRFRNFWGAERDHDDDAPECADAWVFAELLDAGFRDHDGTTFRVAGNFESFLRDLLNVDLRILTVVERARP
jgi:hypothetical protein